MPVTFFLCVPCVCFSVMFASLLLQRVLCVRGFLAMLVSALPISVRVLFQISVLWRFFFSLVAGGEERLSQATAVCFFSCSLSSLEGNNKVELEVFTPGAVVEKVAI